MGHGFRPVISKIRVDNPNEKGTKIKNYNSLHYIATREGVDLTRLKVPIENLSKEDIDLNEAGEELILKEADSETYLKYIAHRPRSHGLFGNIDTENFSDVSRLLNKQSDKKKNIYKGIISLSEIDGQALGYNNVEKWNLLLKSIMPDIAQELGLSPNNITWVAAFHAEQKHPHVHYMLWDNRDIIQEARITIPQQKACRDICQNAIFTDENEKIIKLVTEAERKEIYKLQNASRKDITDYFKSIFNNNTDVPGELTEKLPDRLSPEEHEQLRTYYKNLMERLPGKGRIAYEFMPPDCKAEVDRITELFLKRPDVKAEYDRYMQAVKDIHNILGKTKREITKAREDSVKDLYNRTGNIILKGILGIREEVLSMKKEDEKNEEVITNNDFEVNQLDDISDSEDYFYINENVGIREDEPEFIINEKDTYTNSINKKDKEVRSSREDNPFKKEDYLLKKLEKTHTDTKNAEKSIASAVYKLGSLYADEESVLFNDEKAVNYLERYLNISGGEKSNIFKALVLLGKIYSDKDFNNYNPEIAERHYINAMKLMPEKANFIKIRLSRLYADKDSVLCDYDKAISVLDDASDYKGSVSLQLGKIYSDKNSPLFDMEKAVKMWDLLAEKGNAYGAYHFGHELINKESSCANIKEGINQLEKAVEGNVNSARIELGQIYMNQMGENYNPDKAEEHLINALKDLNKKEEGEWKKLSKSDTVCKDSLNASLGKLYSDSNSNLCDYDKAVKYLKECINGNHINRFVSNSHSNLAKIFSDKENKYYDPYQAEQHFVKAIDIMENMEEDVLKKGHRETENNEEKERRAFSYKNNTIINLSKLYMENESELYNKDSAIYLLKNSLDDDFDGKIAFQLGKIFSLEEEEKELAGYYFREAANKGNIYGKYQLGKILIENPDLNLQYQEGIALLEEAALKKIGSAHLILSNIYSNTKSRYFNPLEAEKHLLEAVSDIEEKSKGYSNKLSKADMQFRNSIWVSLGRLYSNKDIRLCDYKKAIEQFSKCIINSAELDNDEVNAHIGLAKIYSDKRGAYYNPGQAEKEFIDALNHAEKLQKEINASGNVDSKDYREIINYIKSKISSLYSDKTSELCNFTRAINILMTAKDTDGNVSLQLGNIFSEEFSNPHYDMTKAVDYFKVAANKNNTYAMIKLAKCYLYGMGVERDESMAKSWLEQASEQGNSHAGEYLKKIGQYDKSIMGKYSYAILRQIYYSMSQTKAKSIQKLQEKEFKSISKQVKKEDYLHHN